MVVYALSFTTGLIHLYMLKIWYDFDRWLVLVMVGSSGIPKLDVKNHIKYCSIYNQILSTCCIVLLVQMES